ncbi:MAG: hypothetical protein ABI318_16715 [Chthoniobacteraceae bacterium]
MIFHRTAALGAEALPADAAGQEKLKQAVAKLLAYPASAKK